MASSNNFFIKNIEASSLSVKLTDSFTISQGSVQQVNNLLVKLTTQSGMEGYGEIAPFTELSGENIETCLDKFNNVREILIGKSLLEIKSISNLLNEALPDSPAVRCGIEISLLDALSRQLGIPLWSYFGGHKLDLLVTDITIPILPADRSLELAKKWHSKDFRRLKIKVGADYQNEINLIKKINNELTDLEFILDANQGFEENEAIEFLREVLATNAKVVLYEQPINRFNFQAMARIRKMINVPLAADESVFSVGDLKELVKHNAADVVNLKIMKTGVFNTLQIASTALALGLKLMIGGMVETRLAMGCSVAIAMGYCPVDYIDLDTPLLMESDPFFGGFNYCGPDIKPWDTPGLGMIPIF